MGNGTHNEEMGFLEHTLEIIEQLTPEQCAEIVQTIDAEGDSFFDSFPNPELAKAIFKEERANVNDLTDCADMIQRFIRALENGTAEQADLDELAYVILSCALLHPERQISLIGELTSLKKAVDSNPMTEYADMDDAEKKFWNKMAIGGFLHRKDTKNLKPKLIAESYAKVESLACQIREMLLSEEENHEIGLKVQIVPEKPFPDIDKNGMKYVPDTSAQITIDTDDALQLTSAMKEQFNRLLASATECNIVSSGIIAHGEYGIRMVIDCDIPVFSWPDYPL